MIETITHTQYWKDHTSHYIFVTDGSGMVRVTDFGEEIEISDLYVKEDRRNFGVASALVREAINLCKTIRLHGKIVIMTNHNSDNWVSDWYKRLGFRFERAQASLAMIASDEEWHNVYSMEF